MGFGGGTNGVLIHISHTPMGTCKYTLHMHKQEIMSQIKHVFVELGNT